jgi:hypothetical protein
MDSNESTMDSVYDGRRRFYEGLCRLYGIAREELIAEIGFDNFHIAEIMRNTEYMKELIKYINRTRFRE